MVEVIPVLSATEMQFKESSFRQCMITSEVIREKRCPLVEGLKLHDNLTIVQDRIMILFSLTEVAYRLSIGTEIGDLE